MPIKTRNRRSFQFSGLTKPSRTGRSVSLQSQRFKRRSLLISLGIIALALTLTFAPVPGLQQTVTIVSGTELQEILPQLVRKFEQTHPSIKLELKFQGSQDVIDRYLDDQNDFTPTILIPANGELLTELNDRWRAQNGSAAFYDAPRPIAKTLMVGIAWSDRGKVLFPDGQFNWSRLEQALQKKTWNAIGGTPDWGSLDLVLTDPTRSNSGQLALGLWAQSKLKQQALNVSLLNDAAIASLFSLVKRSLYQPPRSTDTLLQEFITRGPNDADVGIVYESVALHRWSQSATTQGQPYQIYYMDPTIETVSTAAIVQRHVDARTAAAARQFLDFLTQPDQQAWFVQYGFRPANQSIDLRNVANSPWNQSIPGAKATPPQIVPTPNRTTLSEILRVWQREN